MPPSSAPPPPPKQGLSASPSWTRVNPQPFVNGRGNVQLVPRPYIPSTSSSSTSSSSNSLASLGQQAYLRSSTSSNDLVGSGGGGGGGGGAGGTTGASFPSAFGVRQRVALKINGSSGGNRDSVIMGEGIGRRSPSSQTIGLPLPSPTNVTPPPPPPPPHEIRLQTPPPPSITPTSPTPPPHTLTTLTQTPPTLDQPPKDTPTISTPLPGPILSVEPSPESSVEDSPEEEPEEEEEDQTANTSALGSILSSPEWDLTFTPIPSPNPPQFEIQSTSSPIVSVTSSPLVSEPRSEILREAELPLPPSPPLSPPLSQSPHLSPPPPSHSPPNSSTTTSILNRPRPKTPDPTSTFSSPSSFSSSTFFSHSNSPNLSSWGPSPVLGAGRFVTSTRVGAGRPNSVIGGGGVMDRGRPKTPDPYASGGGNHYHSHSPSLPTQSAFFSKPSPSLPLQSTSSPPFSHSHPPPPPQPPKQSILNRPRPKTPEPFFFESKSSPEPDPPSRVGVRSISPVFSTPIVSTKPVYKRHGSSGGGVMDRPRPKTPERSVMDRPRPKTPDSGWWMGEREVKVSRIPVFGNSVTTTTTGGGGKSSSPKTGKKSGTIKREDKDLPVLDFGEGLDLKLGEGLGLSLGLSGGGSYEKADEGEAEEGDEGGKTPMPNDEGFGLGFEFALEEQGSDDISFSDRSSLASGFRRSTSPEEEREKKFRRRSLASLLSIGGSPKLEHKDKEKEVVGTISSSSTSSSLGSTSTTTPTALVETSPYHHDKYHHDKSPSQSRSQPHSQSQSPSNSHSHSNSQSHSQSPESYHSHKTPKPYQRPPQLTTSLSSTSSLYLLDKDLPPTPPSTSPTTSDSPTKASGVGGSKLLLQRGLSKLRGKSDSVGFQVISATSTKKWGNSGGRKSEESHRVLGMSLMGGRKSEDVLGREIGAGLEQGRKSEDLLRRDLSGEEEGRNEHTDRLLMLAAVKLAEIPTAVPSSPQGTVTAPLPLQILSPLHPPPPLFSSSTPTTTNSSRENETSSTISLSDESSPSPTSPHSLISFPKAQVQKIVRSNSVILGRGQWRKKSKLGDSGVGSDSSMSSAWLDLEDSLASYVLALSENRPERSQILSNTLLPFLRKEEENPGPRVGETLAKRQRQVLFGWLASLTRELREFQPAHRGACLEGIAAVAESHFLSAMVLQDDPEGQAQYRTTIVNVLSFAVEKLNDKAVYANTLVFSGRVFALAFFRIEGVALKLLRALPSVKRQFLTRVLDEAGVQEDSLPEVDLEAFPPHLWSLCLRDFRTYVSLLLPAIPKPTTPDDHFLVQDGDVSVEMIGNWLIRWTASDSDLPFAFYRAYHRQLASHVVPPEDRDEASREPPMDPAVIITGPGALFIAASLLEKSDALVHRNLRSVTSIGPNNANFNTNDSANLNFGQKPKVLELANRRLVSTMLDIVGGPPLAQGEQGDAPADAETRRHAFSRLLRVWIRACVKRTSMWDTRSVFILLDLIEGLVYTLSYPAPTARSTEEEVIVPRPQISCIEMFDIPFIFSFVKIILSTADNTVALMRTIAFLYAHFEIFTLRPSDRDELCEHIILDETLFFRLYLHWNAGVRGYFIRLLVWRLARLGIAAQEQHPGTPRDPRILELFALLNIRLEAIRKRHDELEPLNNLTDDDLFKPKRSTICSTRGVKEMPYTVEEFVPNTLNESDEDRTEEEEPQELVRTTPAPSSGRRDGIKNVATVAKVVSWLKGGLGKARNNKTPRVPDSHIQPFVVNAPPSHPRSGRDTPDVPSNVSWTTSDSNPDRGTHLSVTTTTPERRNGRSASSAFFEFEFEGGLVAPEAVAKPISSSASASSFTSGDTVFPRSPSRRTFEGPGAPSPRVSLRFSKRISILPPAALDILREIGEAVPPIPPQYLKITHKSYHERLHPYAIRGLRDYEDALDEWTDWMNRLQEEEDAGKKHNKGFMDVVPRLSVAWPSSFEDS